MSNQKDLEDIVDDWLNRVGTTGVSKQYDTTFKFIKIRERRMLLEELVEECYKAGLTDRNYFKGPNQRIIINACCFKTKKMSASEYVAMRGAAERELREAVSEVFERYKGDMPVVISENSKILTPDEDEVVEEQVRGPTPAPSDALPFYRSPVQAPESDEDDEELTPGQLKLISKPFVMPKEVAEEKTTKPSLNYHLLEELGLDPKDIGYDDE